MKAAPTISLVHARLLAMSDLSTKLVPYDYQYDPEKEALYLGSHLVDGMEVLLAERSAPNPLEKMWSQDRWCVVSNFRKDHSFIATYADGSQKVRYQPTPMTWIVKKESI